MSAGIPFGRTARRLEWAHLPPTLRREIEHRCGAAVSDAQSQGGGFTPGFASVLACEDGSRHFVKAASAKAQRQVAAAYREEARKLRLLPADVPAPRLLWTHDRDDWVVLGIEYVDATAPRRPWRAPELQRCLALMTDLADRLTPAPPELSHESFAEEFAAWPAMWEHVRAARPELTHGGEAAALAAGFAEVTVGTTLVHGDIRDDNLLLARGGRTLVCDWNWPVLGAAWLDTLLLLVGPRGDGLDVETVLATHPLTADVPAEHVDIVLALLTGYFLRSADAPVPASSPHLRAHQRREGEVCWDWLAERRGWS